MGALDWLHSVTDGSNTRVELFISDLDGKRRTELGWFRAMQTSEGGDHYGIIGWMPDGKELLFERGDDSESSITRISIPTP